MLEKKLQEVIDKVEATHDSYIAYLTVGEERVPIVVNSIFLDAIDDDTLLIHINAVNS